MLETMVSSFNGLCQDVILNSCLFLKLMRKLEPMWLFDYILLKNVSAIVNLKNQVITTILFINKR